MAFELTGGRLSWVAAADLSAKQHRFTKITTTGINTVSAAGGASCGVLQNAPPAGHTACVEQRPGTVTMVELGDTGAVGDLVVSDSVGRAVPLSSTAKETVDTSDTGAAADAVKGSYVQGWLLEGGAVGQKVAMLFQPIGGVPTTVQ